MPGNIPQNISSRTTGHAATLDHRIPADQTTAAERSALSARAERLLRQEISFIYASEFESLTTERVEAAAQGDSLLIPPAEDAPSGTPPYIAALYRKPLLTPAGETAQFRKMNFLRYRCNVLRSTLDFRNPDPTVLNSIEGMLEESHATRSTIADCNLRLVVATARRLRSMVVPFDERVAEGNLILLKAIDKFDYSRGFRFSTYATLSIQRQILKICQTTAKYRERFPGAPHDLIEDKVSSSSGNGSLIRRLRCLDTLLDHAETVLDERERIIIRERYGLNASRRGRPLREVSSQLGISKERVRQIQCTAIDKLYEVAVENNLLATALVDCEVLQ